MKPIVLVVCFWMMGSTVGMYIDGANAVDVS